MGVSRDKDKNFLGESVEKGETSGRIWGYPTDSGSAWKSPDRARRRGVVHLFTVAGKGLECSEIVP